MWDLPGPGIEPLSPALAGGFLTTAPPGKPCYFCFNIIYLIVNLYDLILIKKIFLIPENLAIGSQEPVLPIR